MILEEDLFSIGHTARPFGVVGEIVVQYDDYEFQNIDVDFYFLRLDGIPVPFYIEEIIPLRDDAARVKFEDISDETEASKYLNVEVLVEKRYVEHIDDYDADSWSDLIGFEVVEDGGEALGTIVDVDDSTINLLLIVKDGDKELFIPATEDYVASIDDDSKTIYLNLPEGFMDIQP
ncbi:MAG: ribosome maturation factor RimM [Fermentimonas sp.]|jgi:16S rRNA processing protein RimM